jgi:hypothetical protein
VLYAARSIATKMENQIMTKVGALLAAMVLSMAPLANGQPSTSTISYQGVLTQNGTSLPDGTYTLTFQLYDAATGGNVIETVTVPDVPTSLGRFTALVPVTPTSFNGSDRWWSVTVSGTELLPRQKVTAVPYAINATGPNLRLVGVEPSIRLADTLETTFGQGSFWEFGTAPWNVRGGIALYRHTFEDTPRPAIFIDPLGEHVGIGLRPTDIGSPAMASAALHVAGEHNGVIRLMQYDTPDAGWWTIDPNAFDQGGFSILFWPYGDLEHPRKHLSVDKDGVTSVKVLTILGADVAEKFDIAPVPTTPDEPKPGMVVSIDPANPGKLMVATAAYDKKVAGVISGANGLSVGAVLGQGNADPLIDGDHPVAMAGRVWVYADDSAGPIQPGDRLTTSGVKPGHAMRVVNSADADGAVIGKAMTPIDPATGMCLMLVNLQ